MQQTITRFDTTRHHIYTTLVVTHPRTKTQHNFLAIIDTGAPVTEFVDSVLMQAGIIESTDDTVAIKRDLESQKYRQVSFPLVEICGFKIENFEVYVARLDPSWGIDALIGLDFFRKHKVTIDYSRGVIITSPFE